MTKLSVDFILAYGLENKELLDTAKLNDFLCIKKTNNKKKMKSPKKTQYLEYNDNKDFNLLLNKLSESNLRNSISQCNILLLIEKNTNIFLKSISDCILQHNVSQKRLYVKFLHSIEKENIVSLLIDYLNEYLHSIELSDINTVEDYDLMCDINKKKTHINAIYSFYGELYLSGALPLDNINSYIDDLFKKIQLNNLYVEILCNFIKVFEQGIKKELKKNLKDRIMDEINNNKYKPRDRFMFQDIIELLC